MFMKRYCRHRKAKLGILASLKESFLDCLFMGKLELIRKECIRLKRRGIA